MDAQQIIQDALERLQIGAEELREDLARHAADEAASLALIVEEPGFDEAVVASRDSLVLHAALSAVEAGEAVDREKLNQLAGILTAVALVIA